MSKRDIQAEHTPGVYDVNSHELHCIAFLAGLDSQLHVHEQHIEQRLKRIPGAWRDYRLALRMIEKVVDAVYATMPGKTKQRLIMLHENGEVVIRPRPASATRAYVQIVANEDMKIIANKAIENECAICMKREGEVRSCALRRALLTVCPPTQINDEGGGCPYQNVAQSHDLGHYM